MRKRAYLGGVWKHAKGGEGAGNFIRLLTRKHVTRVTCSTPIFHFLNLLLRKLLESRDKDVETGACEADFGEQRSLGPLSLVLPSTSHVPLLRIHSTHQRHLAPPENVILATALPIEDAVVRNWRLKSFATRRSLSGAPGALLHEFAVISCSNRVLLRSPLLCIM